MVDESNLRPDLSMDELAESLARNAGTRGPRPCRRCGTSWIPKDWNFYDLCDACFALFDSQRMAGRLFGCPLFPGLKIDEPLRDAEGKVVYFEIVDAWMAWEKGE
jgi:hypothetical protein